MPGTFLIADDNEAKRIMLESLVKKSKQYAKILSAKTTGEARKLIEEHAIDAAFIDYEIPTEWGPEVIYYLKEKNPTAHVALVTSADSEKYKEEAEKAGSEAFICTSRTEEEVVAEIERVLGEWKMD